MRLILHFDGSCWVNPGGTAKYGWTLDAYDTVVHERGSGFAGEGPTVSNNFAEFFAMAEGLNYALSHARPGDQIEVLGDSEMAIKLMQGKYKASKDKLYYPQYARCMDILQVYYRHNIDVEFKWIPREKNTECDELSKMPAQKPVSAELLAEAEDLLL